MHKCFLLMVLFSLVMIMSSQSWVMTWMGLEMMTFFFIPYLCSSSYSNYFMKISSWKYFMYQSLGSVIFLASIQYSSYTATIMSYKLFSLITYSILIFSMYMKMGMFPFHFWMLEVSENMDMVKFIVINSIQKLGSLMVVWSFTDMMFKVMSTTIILLGYLSVYSLFSSSFRFILVFSSMLNMMWMLLSLINKSTAMEYMLFYSLLITCMCLFLSMSNISDFSNLMSHSISFNWTSQFMFMMIICVTMGIPPFIGFVIKLDVLLELIKNDMLILSFSILLFSVVFSIFYLYPIMFLSMMRVSLKLSLDLNKSVTFNLMLMLNLLVFMYYYMYS